MASTWGNNTWGSNEWQDDVVTISISGLSATTSLGSTEAFNTSGWGRQQWSNSGWGVNYSVEPTGVSSTISQGTAFESIASAPDVTARVLVKLQKLPFCLSNAASTGSEGAPG